VIRMPAFANRGRFEALYRGMAMAFPIMLGYFPLAVAYGILSFQAGLPLRSTAAMSVLVYAGASQFMAVNMLGLGAAGTEIVLACFMINIRHIVMSMSLMQRLADLTPAGRKAAALGVTDETFALLSFSEIRSGPTKGWLLAGVLVSAYGAWVSGSVVGALLSTVIPGDLAASMAIALYAMFIGLLVPNVKRHPPALTIAAAGALLCTVLTPQVGAGWAIAFGTLGGGLVGVLHAASVPEDADQEEQA